MDWLEKYKPRSIDEVVGNKELKQAVKHWIQHPDEMPHLLFAGKTGTGKTTIAYIIAKEILKDGFTMSFKEINASDNNNEVAEMSNGSMRNAIAILQQKAISGNSIDDIIKTYLEV